MRRLLETVQNEEWDGEKRGRSGLRGVGQRASVE